MISRTLTDALALDGEEVVLSCQVHCHSLLFVKQQHMNCRIGKRDNVWSQMRVFVDDKCSQSHSFVDTHSSFLCAFVLQVSGNPQPLITWLRNDEVLQAESKDYVQKYDGQTATLTIEDVMTDDSGDIKIVAENTVGRVESVCRLQVEGKFSVFCRMSEKSKNGFHAWRFLFSRSV